MVNWTSTHRIIYHDTIQSIRIAVRRLSGVLWLRMAGVWHQIQKIWSTRIVFQGWNLGSQFVNFTAAINKCGLFREVKEYLLAATRVRASLGPSLLHLVPLSWQLWQGVPSSHLIRFLRQNRQAFATCFRLPLGFRISSASWSPARVPNMIFQFLRCEYHIQKNPPLKWFVCQQGPQ